MRLRIFYFAALSFLLFLGCDKESGKTVPSTPPRQQTLTDARHGFVTKLIREQSINAPVPEPAAELFRSVTYQSPIGNMAAYVSVPPGDGRRHPAIIWLVGGFANSVSEIAWEPQPAKNDQSASTFRKAGILMMYPSLRGGNENPGHAEGFFGEVNDVLAAADYLAKLDYVDTNRIYLGGHSTGGTLALLAAESSDRFRAVFSLGPVSDVRGYGQDVLPFNVSDSREALLRSPGKWLHCIHAPTHVFESNGRRSNIDELKSMARQNQNPMIHFYPINGGDHFSVILPVSKLIAEQILKDDQPVPNIVFTDGAISAAMRN